jgi:hypothetical protein
MYVVRVPALRKRELFPFLCRLLSTSLYYIRSIQGFRHHRVSAGTWIEFQESMPKSLLTLAMPELCQGLVKVSLSLSPIFFCMTYSSLIPLSPCLFLSCSVFAG